METIRKIRLAHHREGKSIRQIARDFHLSKNTVKKIIRSGATELIYRREIQPRPKLGAFEDRLSQLLRGDQQLPRREQRTAYLLFEELQREGFAGGYDSIRRYVQQWKEREKSRLAKAFIPLSFPIGIFFFRCQVKRAEPSGRPVCFVGRIDPTDIIDPATLPAASLGLFAVSIPTTG